MLCHFCLFATIFVTVVVDEIQTCVRHPWSSSFSRRVGNHWDSCERFRQKVALWLHPDAERRMVRGSRLLN